MDKKGSKKLGFIELTELVECQHNDEIVMLKEGIDEAFAKAVKRCLEQEKKLNAPRLSPESIDRVIRKETFTILPSGKAVVCELVLNNGFSVRGDSACVSKENFNEEIGRKIARKNASNEDV